MFVATALRMFNKSKPDEKQLLTAIPYDQYLEYDYDDEMDGLINGEQIERQRKCILFAASQRGDCVHDKKTNKNSQTYNSVVNTVYSTVDALGALKTETFSRILVSQTATTVTGTQTAPATTATNCPLQTQVSCFTITATGTDHINGKQLYLSKNSSSPVWGGWGAGYEVGVFYLTCAGDLVALPSMDVLAPAQNKWAEFGSFASTTTKQSCSQDTSSGILSCGSGWYATSPTALRYTDFRAFSGDWQPIWNDATNKDTLTPVVLTYNTVVCPCQY